MGYLPRIHQTRVYSPKYIPKYIKNIYNSTPGRHTIQFKKWAKDLNRHLSKEDIQMAQRHMKKMLKITSHPRDAN